MAEGGGVGSIEEHQWVVVLASVQKLGAFFRGKVRGCVESVVDDGREDPAEFLVHQALACRTRQGESGGRSGRAGGRGTGALRPVVAGGVDELASRWWLEGGLRRCLGRRSRGVQSDDRGDALSVGDRGAVVGIWRRKWVERHESAEKGFGESRRPGIGISIGGKGMPRPGEGGHEFRQIANRDLGGNGDASVVEEREAVGFR
jgi:hypothetical protein